MLTPANIGVPMIFVHWPLMVCAVVPVIVIESLLIRRWLPISYREAFTGCSLANALSTLVGVPLAWLAMLALELVVMMPLGFATTRFQWHLNSPIFHVLAFLFSIAWLGPVEHHLYWMVPLAAALLLIPSFYASVWLERVSCCHTWSSHDSSLVCRGVFRANLASYGVLFLLACGWVCFAFLTTQSRL